MDWILEPPKKASSAIAIAMYSSAVRRLNPADGIVESLEYVTPGLDENMFNLVAMVKDMDTQYTVSILKTVQLLDWTWIMPCEYIQYNVK